MSPEYCRKCGTHWHPTQTAPGCPVCSRDATPSPASDKHDWQPLNPFCVQCSVCKLLDGGSLDHTRETRPDGCKGPPLPAPRFVIHPTVDVAALQAELAAAKAERDKLRGRIDATLAELPAIIDRAVIEGYPSIAINAIAAKLRGTDG